MVTAEEARENQRIADARFLAGAGADALELQRQVGLILSAFRFGGDKRKQANVPQRIRIIKALLAKGTINERQLQVDPRGVIRKYENFVPGQQEEEQRASSGLPIESPDKTDFRVDIVQLAAKKLADMLERERKAKAGT